MRICTTVTSGNKAELLAALQAAPSGSFFELRTDIQTRPQQRLMWALLGKLSKQLIHCGEYIDREAWKSCFMKAMGVRLSFIPALDGEGIVCLGYRSARLSKEQMSEIIERIYEYGARHGVDFE